MAVIADSEFEYAPSPASAARRICSFFRATGWPFAFPFRFHFVLNQAREPSHLVLELLLDAVGLQNRGAPKQLKSAVAASFFPLWVPSLSSVTSGGIAPKAPIVTLFSSTTERLNKVAAEFSRASMLPRLSTLTMPGTASEDMILPLLSSHMERLSSAVTACSWMRESGMDRRLTSRGIAPASAIATRLSALRLARSRISPAAVC
nr:Os12g0570075 [Ipomoea trifida]